MHITSSRVASRMSFRVPPANLALLLVIINCLPLISSNKPEGSSDNEVTHKGSALKEMFNTFQLPTEFLEIEKIKKVRATSLLAASLRNNTRSSQPSAIREEIVVKACTPDALPWLGPKGYCVPTNLLLTFCGEYESSASSDCPQAEGNWCCYKPTPAAPSIISPYSRPTYLDVKPCTPDLYPWMGPKGFCSATDQLNEYCPTLEISASNRDCPGRENWCCYKPIPKDGPLYMQPCRPDVFPQLERTGFCAATYQLNTFCTTLEISVASSDCTNHPGNWCCYLPPPPSHITYTLSPGTRPSVSPTYTVPTSSTTRTITSTSPSTSPATVGYPKSYCQTNPEFLQCRSTTTTTPSPIGLPNYFAGTPPYLPCAIFGYLPNCATTTTSTHPPLPSRNAYNVYTNLKRLQEPGFNMRLGTAIDPEESVIFGREGF